jgi:hypothetical protein
MNRLNQAIVDSNRQRLLNKAREERPVTKVIKNRADFKINGHQVKREGIKNNE